MSVLAFDMTSMSLQHAYGALEIISHASTMNYEVLHYSDDRRVMYRPVKHGAECLKPILKSSRHYCHDRKVQCITDDTCC